MRRFQLVIFDNDGVLVDSEPLASRVLASLLGEAGLVMTAEECMAQFLGLSLSGVAARLGVALPDDFAARYHQELFSAFAASLRPVPGVDDVLRRLGAAGIALWVASSGSLERVRMALAVTGLADYFGDRVVSVDEVARGKPAPDLFLRVAALAGVAPEACAVVEDSPAGVSAAATAGMTAVGYAGRTPAAALAGAAGGVVTEMASLPTLLGV